MNNIVPFKRPTVHSLLNDPDAMRRVLTDPDALADYVNWFYGLNGPCPTQCSTDDPDEWVEWNAG